MTKQLRADEMIAVALLTDSEDLKRQAMEFSQLLESISNDFADCMAMHFDVLRGPTTCEEPEFAGCCTPFYAKKVGQPCPEELRAYDETEWQTTDGIELDPETGKEW